MTCTSALFNLLLGSIVLSGAAIYFYFQNIVDILKLKVSSLNTALTSSQYERGDIMTKNDQMFAESATQKVMNEKLKEEILKLQESVNQFEKSATQNVTNEKLKEEISKLQESVNRLENDNNLLINAYKTIETNSKMGVRRS